jgi:hypothetical protein
MGKLPFGHKTRPNLAPFQKYRFSNVCFITFLEVGRKKSRIFHDFAINDGPSVAARWVCQHSNKLEIFSMHIGGTYWKEKPLPQQINLQESKEFARAKVHVSVLMG